MTAREAYFKVYVKSELPIAMVGFTFKDKNDVIHLGNSVWLDFHEGHEVNIKKLEKVQKRKDFMFWNISDEGEKFFKVNAKEIGNLLAQIIINQK
jgi:hypothetical protein